MASFFSCLVDCAGFDLLDYPTDERDSISRTRHGGTNTHSQYAAGRKLSKGGRRISDKGGQDKEVISVYSSSTGKLVSPSACPGGAAGNSNHRSSSEKVSARPSRLAHARTHFDCAKKWIFGKGATARGKKEQREEGRNKICFCEGEDALLLKGSNGGVPAQGH